MISDTSSKKSRNKELKTLLGGARVNLEAVIGDAKLTLRELFDLQKGDILILNRPADDTAVLCVDGEDKFIAKLGLSRFRKTVEVEEAIRTEHDDVKEILIRLEEERRKKIQAFKGEAQ
jgi:flagellar motor switch protein FliM